MPYGPGFACAQFEIRDQSETVRHQFCHRHGEYAVLVHGLPDFLEGTVGVRLFQHIGGPVSFHEVAHPQPQRVSALLVGGFPVPCPELSAKFELVLSQRSHHLGQRRCVRVYAYAQRLLSHHITHMRILDQGIILVEICLRYVQTYSGTDGLQQPCGPFLFASVVEAAVPAEGCDAS